MSKANALRALVVVCVLSVLLALWFGRQGIIAAGFVGVLITFGMLFDRANAPSGRGSFPNSHVSYRPRPALSDNAKQAQARPAKIDLFWTVLVTGVSLILAFNRYIFD